VEPLQLPHPPQRRLLGVGRGSGRVAAGEVEAVEEAVEEAVVAVVAVVVLEVAAVLAVLAAR